MEEKYAVYYEKLKEWKDSEEIFLSLFSHEKCAFWLDSSKVEENVSRFSYMGTTDNSISYSLNKNSQNIFSYLAKELEKLTVKKTNLPFDFVGGFVGYFGYELKTLCGSENHFISDYPDSLWYFVNKMLVFDHKKKEIYLVCLVKKEKDAEEWFGKIKNEIQKISPLPKLKIYSRKTKNLLFNLAQNKKQYIRNINECKRYLKNGNSYEICLTNTITTTLAIDPLLLYRQLRRANPAPYAAYIKYGDVTILCSSPERFLKIDQKRRVESKPIKGTIKRSMDTLEDEKLAQHLHTSEKDRAENLMIVDLVRNDLGKVCEIGSISVPKLMAIESYQTVHQLVSTIQGTLKKNISVIDCIKACFPGGSMTGAPKIRTMEILDRLEGKARGIYSGSLGFLSANGASDLNIVIRTIIVKEKALSLGAGGAILMQSDPEKEYDEMLLKAKVLMQAITQTADSKGHKIIGDKKTSII